MSQPTPQLQALRTCGIKAASAIDGRSLRGARVECTNALARLGHSSTDALRMANAMVAVGSAIKQMAEGRAS